MIGNSLWQLIINSDAITVIILLLLATLSIISWSVFVIQFYLMRENNKQLSSLVGRLDSAELTLDSLLSQVNQQLNTSAIIDIGALFLGEQFHALNHVCNNVGEHKIQLLEKKDQVMSVVDAVLYDAVDRYVAQEVRKHSLFATIAAVSPLLGLLGTVWGLIHAFLQISQTQVADLATVAPGISEALITTLVGLVVAIPALVFFNIMNSYSSSFELMLEKIGMKYRVLVLTQLAKGSDEKI